MADKSITMKDVALEAGVALGTVSKVVNGIPVGKSYQRRVDPPVINPVLCGAERSHRVILWNAHIAFQ